MSSACSLTPVRDPVGSLLGSKMNNKWPPTVTAWSEEMIVSENAVQIKKGGG